MMHGQRVFGRVVCALGALLTLSSLVSPVAAQTSPVPMDTPIQFMSLSPADSVLTVGQQQGLTATATLATSPVQTRILGGGGGDALWQVTFAPGLPVSGCNTGATAFTSQTIPVAASGEFHAVWSPGSPDTVKVDGAISPSLPPSAGSAVSASLACVLVGGITGSLGGAWSATQFDGTYSFAGTVGDIALVGLTWTSSDPAVAVVDQTGRVTALAPGAAIITATFGNRCWQPSPGDNPGCRGTTSADVAVQVTPSGGGGGGGECAVLTVTLAEGSVPVTQVDTTIIDPATGSILATFPFTIGAEQEAPEGQFRLRFTPPEGLTVSPEQVDLDIHCGDRLGVELLFAEDLPQPTIDTLIEQAEAAGLSQASNLLRNARARLLAGNTTAACNQLGAYMNQVGAQSGNQLAPDAAGAMLASAAAVQSALGCR